ncbi:MAG TPA: potassium transporter TrkG, partial [Bacteroidales bacterium]|nr:potassium transporter TrkG [Bacteroidales bacterium]
MKLFNIPAILRIQSNILIIETILLLLCLPVGFIYREPTMPFVLSAIITIVISAVLYILSGHTDLRELSHRDGYLSVSLSWIIFSLLGAFPFVFSGATDNYIDALFETASGVTTTGASIFSNVEQLPKSILFWRSLTHWIGGLGIIVLVIIILPSFRITNYSIFSMESSLKEKFHPKTKSIGYRLLYIYLGLTIAEIILLAAGEMDLFDSICHTFGTVATG